MPSVTVPTIIAGVGAAGGIASGVLNSNATSSAAKAQAKSAKQAAQIQATSQQQAVDAQTGIYNQTRSDLSPYLSTGSAALSQLSNLLGIGGGAPNTSALESALQNYPGYQFSLDQGLQAVNQSGAARGLLNSGATIKDATQYGQGLAQSTLADYLGRLASTASLGESAGSITGNAGAAAGSQIGSSLINGANGQASSLIQTGNAAGNGILGSSLALTGGINGALNNSLLAYQLSQQGSSGAADPSLSNIWSAQNGTSFNQEFGMT
jgi:hypothetical protein